MSKRIYLDYAASTPLNPEVKEAMEPYWSDNFANAGGIHQEGVAIKKVLNNCRESLANILDSRSDEVIFTSGGTEANSLAILGFLNNLDSKGKLFGSHIITSNIEHPSVLEVFKRLQKKGVRVDFAPVGEDGIVDLEKFKKLLKPETVFVSIMYVNNEIGTIQPLKEISKILDQLRKDNFFDSKFQIPNSKFPIFHTDASQAPVFLETNVKKLGVDLMSLDAQKVYGPKGVGCLYKKYGVEIESLFIGGSQEWGLRPGTENIPLIVGFVKAMEIVEKNREENTKKVKEIRDYLIEKVLQEIPKAILNGDRERRIANNANFSFPGNDLEYLILQLDAEGVSLSTKSACFRNNSFGSYVIGVLRGLESGEGIRFTLGLSTTKEDMDRLVEILKEKVEV